MEEMQLTEVTVTIEHLLRDKNLKELRERLADLHPADIAEMFDELDAADCLIVFRLLQKDDAARVFSFLSQPNRERIVSAIDESLLHYVFNELFLDDKIDFLEDMPANFVRRLIMAAPVSERKLINQFLQFPEDSAGSLMTIEYVELKHKITAKQALAQIKASAMDKETIYTCYVVDDERVLIGAISLRHLVLADEEAIIEDIMSSDVVSCHASDDQEEVADLFKKYDFTAMPVVDNEQRLVGIITVDDSIDVIEEENTEDFHRMAAMAPSDEAYLDVGVFTLTKRRIVWLMVLMVSATITGGIISHYEDMLSSMVILTTFIPMLMDTGGNSGNQSSTLIIRGIALGEITLKDWMKVLKKELGVSILAGIALAIANFIRMAMIGNADIKVMLTVSATLIATVVIAKLIGGILPIVAKTLRMDPAIMAGPLITTIVDAVVLVVYFGVASLLLF